MFFVKVVDVLVNDSDKFQQFTTHAVRQTVDFSKVQFRTRFLTCPLWCNDWCDGLDSVENRLEVPLQHFLDQAVDFLIVAQRQIPMAQKFW